MPASAVEQAKLHSYNASLASLDGDLEKALDELIIASELYVKAISNAAVDKPARQKLMELFDETAEEAERIKVRQRAQGSSDRCETRSESLSRAGVGSYVRPEMQVHEHRFRMSRAIPRKEQVILLQSSQLSEATCPIWNDDHVERALQCSEVFTLPSSWPTQVFAKHKCIEKRLADIIEHAGLDSTDCILYPTLRQNVWNDCSFVCALIVADQWSNRFRTRLLTNRLYPQNAQGHCTPSTHGKHMAKWWLHGSERQIVVDDRLPVPNQGQIQDLLVFSQAHKDIVWPALLEKLYYSVKGKKFAGSSSANDLYMMAGWIPEEIFLHAPGINLEKQWQSLEDAWKRGQVLVTTGSCQMSEAEQNDHRLASDHNYAVVGMQSNAEGERTLTMQDPWGGARQRENGSIFEITCDKARLLFNALYLSWDPKLWKYRELRHVRYELDASFAKPICLYLCPQMLIMNELDRAVDVVVVVSKHSQDASGHTSIALYDNGGMRQFIDQNCIACTDHLASIDITMRYTLPTKAQITLVILQTQTSQSTAYTVAVHHNEDTPAIHLNDVQDRHLRPADLHVHDGAWTVATAGGNANHLTFVKNPHFVVTVAEPCDLTCALEAASELNVQLDLVLLKSGQTRVANPHSNNRVATSKSYQRMSTSMSASAIQPGQYAIICSTWQPGELGEFRLTNLLTPAMGDGWSSQLLPSWRVLAPLGHGQSHHQMSGQVSAMSAEANIILITPASNVGTVYLHMTPPRQRAQVKLIKVLEQRTVVAQIEGETSLSLEPIKLGVLPQDGQYELQITLLASSSARVCSFLLDMYASLPLSKFELV
jgi:hypothetical protein